MQKYYFFLHFSRFLQNIPCQKLALFLPENDGLKAIKIEASQYPSMEKKAAIGQPLF